MNCFEQEAIRSLQNLINSNVNKEEILFYLQESFPNYAPYFGNAASDVTLSVSDVFIFLKDVPDAFTGICDILSNECQQSFIVEALQESITALSTEMDTAPSESRSIPENHDQIIHQLGISQRSSTHIHASLVDKVVADILSHETKEIIVTGPKGSGKTSLIRDIQHRLHLNHTYECLHLDLEAKRFSSVLGELDYFVGRKTFTDKKAIFLDNCDNCSLSRLMDGSDCSIYQEAKEKGLVICFTLLDVNLNEWLPNAKLFSMPTCSNENVEEILSSSFHFAGGKLDSLNATIQNYPRYPLHVTLMGSLFISVKEAHFEFLKNLPPLENDKDFVEQILKAIVDVRNSFDEMHVIASVAMYHDVGGACNFNVTFLLSKLKFDNELIDQCLDSLVECKLLTASNDKYFLYANYLRPFMKISQFENIWKKLLSHFCLEYLRYCEIIIDSLNEDKNVYKQWSNFKKYIIKALTHDLSATDKDFPSIFFCRCRVVSKLKLLWQARLLTFIECVDIYETVTAMIDKGRSSGQSEKIVSYEREILIQYASLFFYFQKVTQNKSLLSIIFSNIHKVNQSLSNPSDELSCELVNLIIEYKIQDGMLEEAMKYLVALIKMQQDLDISKDSVALSKIRLAQIRILKNEDLDFVNEEMLGDNFSTTPLLRPQLISTKMRMSRGDLYYMQNDFVTTGWNYEMALYGLDDLNPDNLYLQGEYSKLKQNIHCRLGKLGLQSNDRDELSKSLQHFTNCQQFYQSIEEGSKYHKYFVYSAVTHMLMGDNSKALYEILDYMKYTPHKPMFIAVTDLDAQQIISRNLQERLEGNELQFIDNHVYQGKVNFLHLIKTNYEWVKNQANDEIIEINVDKPEKTIRANVLQFPNQMCQSNKCLVVVFLESQHQRIYSDRTNVSEQSHISLSSFRSEIVDPGSEEDINEDSSDRARSSQIQPRSIVDAVFHNSLNIAKDVVDRAKHGFIESLTTSIFDRIF
ncbi:hypothetical protein ACHWQZ_G016528 [Mnemiopsis leidyi]